MEAFQKNTFNIKEILESLDYERQAYELELLKLVDKGSHETTLTYAETILFIEGSNLGIADCTLPPYVFYESDSLSGIERDSCIRSEFLEWCLDASISKTLLKNGLLKVEGATILSSLDFNSEKYSYEKVEHEQDEEYSLDLSNRNIGVDLTLKNCILLKGLTIKDSYTENIILERIRIGKTYDDGKELSLNASNAIIKGDLRIDIVLSTSKKKELSLQGDILLDYAIIENSVIFKSEWEYLKKPSGAIAEIDKQTSGQFSGLSGTYMETNFVDISGCHFHGSINLYSSKVKQAFLSSNIFISGGYSIENIQAPVTDISKSHLRKGLIGGRASFSNYILLSWSTFDGDVDFGNFQVGGFHAEHAILNGVNGLNLGGSTISSIWLDNAICYYGVYLHKSEIAIDLSCSGTYFGPTINPDYNGYAFFLTNSKVRNAYLDEGCVIDGGLDLKGAEIESLCLQNAFFHDCKEKHDVKVHCDKSYAIRATDVKISKRITFNPTKTAKPEPYRVHYYTLLRTYGKFTGLHESSFLSDTLNLLLSTINDFQRKRDLEKIKKHLSEQKESTEIAIKNAIKEDNGSKQQELEYKFYESHFTHANTLASYGYLIDKQSKSISDPFARFTQIVKAIRALHEVDHYCKTHNGIKEHSAVRKIDRYSIAYGEVNFEGLKLIGNMDCAGGIFYRRDIVNINNPIIGKKKFFKTILGFTIHEMMHMKKEITSVNNALTLSHSYVDGSVYLNNGDEINRLPFLAQGEIDLQYSHCNHLYITPYFARQSNVRWNLIGLNYETLTLNTHAQSGKYSTAGSINRSYDWIFPYYNKDNFRQPFEQLASSLFKNGSDIIGRSIIVNRTPSRGRREALLMFFIRAFFWLTFPLEQALISLAMVIALGTWYFNHACSVNYLKGEDKGMDFHALYFSLQKLIPFTDGEQEKNFIVNNRLADTWFELFYNVYPLLGTFLISMIILNLARMRKNSN